MWGTIGHEDGGEDRRIAAQTKMKAMPGRAYGVGMFSGGSDDQLGSILDVQLTTGWFSRD